MSTHLSVNSQRPVAESHVAYLDGLRAIAALYVVIHHASMQMPGEAESWLVKLLVSMFKQGHYSVDLFIVLSGFCLMLPVVKNNGVLPRPKLDFLKRRAKRILPPYYLAMLFSLVLISTLIGEKTNTHWDVSIPVSTFDILTHLTLVQDVFNSSSAKINHTFWSVSVEWRIYLFFPALLISWKKRGAFWVTTLLVVLSTALWFVLEAAHVNKLNMTPYGLCIHYVGMFAFGMLAAQLSFSTDQFYKRIGHEITGRAFFYLTLFCSFVILLFRKQVHWVFIDLAIGLVSFSLLIMLSTNRLNRLKALLSKPVLTFTGTFAYSIYLIHAPVIQVVHQYLVMPLHLNADSTRVALIFSSPIIVVAASYLFFLLAEQPFIPKKHAPKPQRPVPVSA